MFITLTSTANKTMYVNTDSILRFYESGDKINGGSIVIMQDKAVHAMEKPEMVMAKILQAKVSEIFASMPPFTGPSIKPLSPTPFDDPSDIATRLLSKDE